MFRVFFSLSFEMNSSNPSVFHIPEYVMVLSFSKLAPFLKQSVTEIQKRI